MYLSTLLFSTLFIPSFLAAHASQRCSKLIDHGQDGTQPRISDRKYVVSLNPSRQTLSSFLQSSSIKPEDKWEEINAFSGTLTEVQIKQLCLNDHVRSISRDLLLHSSSIQYPSPWGLARLTSGLKLHPQSLHTYYPINGGEGSDIYVIDSGIMVDHTDFEGRARWDRTFVPYANKERDVTGHGTSCASVAAGKMYGVAKKANIISIKVQDDNGWVHTIAVINAIIHVNKEIRELERPAVVLLPFSDQIIPIVDDIVSWLAGQGVHVVVAAGNDNVNARLRSPARLNNVITVGATNIADERASFSNWGPAVDIHAPGVDIPAAHASSDEKNNNVMVLMSGTSMAAAHVAGLVACILVHYKHRKLSPQRMTQEIQELAIFGNITNMPRSNRHPTLNLLAHVEPPPNDVRKKFTCPLKKPISRLWTTMKNKLRHSKGSVSSDPSSTELDLLPRPCDAVIGMAN